MRPGTKNTFCVNEAKSVWYCHSDSCKKNGERAGGNVIDFVALIEQCFAYAAAKRIDEWFPNREWKGEKRGTHDGMMTREVVWTPGEPQEQSARVPS